MPKISIIQHCRICGALRLSSDHKTFIYYIKLIIYFKLKSLVFYYSIITNGTLEQDYKKCSGRFMWDISDYYLSAQGLLLPSVNS